MVFFSTKLMKKARCFKVLHRVCGVGEGLRVEVWEGWFVAIKSGYYPVF